MTKPNKRRYKLETILAKREEAVGGRDIEFEWAGETYTFPHPLFAPDEWQAELSAAGGDNAQAGRAILGDDYDRFHAAGGHASFLLMLMQEVTEDVSGTTPDGTPTQSSTS